MAKTSSAVRLERVETGRTHMVGGAEQPLEGADGKPEREYALMATVDGVSVRLASYAAGPIEAQVAAGTQELEPEPEDG